MLDQLFSPHLNDLQRGLNRASLRQGVLMDNLANANVPGYKRRDVDFNVTLSEEMGKGGIGAGGAAGGVESGAKESEGSVRVDGSSVDPEQEALGIAQTELRFQTISDLTAGYFSNLKSAIREGK